MVAREGIEPPTPAFSRRFGNNTELEHSDGDRADFKTPEEHVITAILSEIEMLRQVTDFDARLYT
jgi:hypothetical protein